MLDRESTRQLDLIGRLVGQNPFTTERQQLEQQLLGKAYLDQGQVWHAREPRADNPNIAALARLTAELTEALRQSLLRQERTSELERWLARYRDAVLYLLYSRYEEPLLEQINAVLAGQDPPLDCFRQFVADGTHYYSLPQLPAPDERDWAHLFACFYQIRRAFEFIHRGLLGASRPMATLRASIWESIFSRDMRRYRRVLYQRMQLIPTLIIGASGTGKDLVAQAIGYSGYIPFDTARRRFVGSFVEGWLPVNLAALPATLIESELFGHRRGAFTGAVEAHCGYLEACPAHGAVFLDEIGELEPATQVKLLRALQNRAFARVGETEARPFVGRIVAATHRDLAERIVQGTFRADLFYRLRADQIETPTLAAQLAERPEDVALLVTHLLTRLLGDDRDQTLVEESLSTVRALGTDYRWPGNVRELEQCVRSVMLRGSYRPPNFAHGGADRLSAALQDCELSADELLARYVTLTYAKQGSFSAAGKALGLDRRTVAAKLDAALLERLGLGTVEPSRAN
ncbi:MAG: sigma-54-dependent Fis family transcriptional regulator [Deltaproteobacteria bacterium]|nr:sigma-54-dependent Fis family transcriptional regulator [Deltaproteobacteria bacterium]